MAAADAEPVVGASFTAVVVDWIGLEGPAKDIAEAPPAGGIRNSTGARSDVLSIVIDLPCPRAAGASCDIAGCVVGVDTTLFGGVEVMLSTGWEEITGRGGLGGGAMAPAFEGVDLGVMSNVGGLAGKAGRGSSAY
jgi:hypothetical protein